MSLVKFSSIFNYRLLLNYVILTMFKVIINNVNLLPYLNKQNYTKHLYSGLSKELL